MILILDKLQLTLTIILRNSIIKMIKKNALKVFKNLKQKYKNTSILHL